MCRDTTSELQISLIKLLELYGHALHHKPCTLTVGTGSSIKIIDENDHIRLEKYPLTIKTAYKGLQQSLDPLLREVFEKKNVREGRGERENSFHYADKKLKESEIEYDVKELYHRLTED